MVTKTKVSNVFDNRTLEEWLDTYEWKCLSTDTKPTAGVATNDVLIELDTGDAYYFDGAAWVKVGG